VAEIIHRCGPGGTAFIACHDRLIDQSRRVRIGHRTIASSALSLL